MRSYKTRASGPIAALLWENFRLTYLAFFVSLLLGAGMTHSLAEVDRASRLQMMDPIQASYAICLFALFLYAAILLFSLADPKDLNMRIPNRHYTMPVNTRTLIAVHLVYRVATFTVLALVLLILQRTEYGNAVQQGLWQDLAIALAVFSYAQAIAWTFGNVAPRWVAATIGSLPAVGLAVLAVARMARSVVQLSDWSKNDIMIPLVTGTSADGTRMGIMRIAEPQHVRISRDLLSLNAAEYMAAGAIVLTAAFLVVAFAGALKGRTRTGTMTEPRAAARDWLSRGLRITPSSVQAQAWYEWRRKGLVLPGITGVLVVLWFALTFPFYFSENDRSDVLADMLILQPFYLSFFAAFFAGLYLLSVDYRHASTGLATFLFSRPLSTEQLLQARLRMSIRSVLLNFALCLAIAALGVAVAALNHSRSLDHALGKIDIEDVLLALASIVGHTILVWSILWMCVPVMLYLFWFGCYFYYLTLLSDGFESANEHTMQFWLVWLPTLVLVILTAAVWRAPVTWRSLSHTMLANARRLLYLTLIVGAVLGWLSGALDDSLTTRFDAVSFMIGVVGLSLLPALSIISQPLLLERLRRR